MRTSAAAAVVGLALAGCGTVVPMQTASVVPAGDLRLGAQASAGFCDFAPPDFPCNVYPDGFPLPALRVDARRGVGRASDLGASLSVQTMMYAPERPLQIGLTLDGKRELVRGGGGGGAAHVLSVGPLLGGAVAGRLGLAPWLQTEAGVPLFYGLETTRFEWVASAFAVYRALFPSVGGDQDLPAVHRMRFGVGLGLYRRAPARWGVQIGYDTDPDPLLGGAVQAQFGWFWDLPRG
jgi:hypothetical protein